MSSNQRHMRPVISGRASRGPTAHRGSAMPRISVHLTRTRTRPGRSIHAQRDCDNRPDHQSWYDCRPISSGRYLKNRWLTATSGVSSAWHDPSTTFVAIVLSISCSGLLRRTQCRRDHFHARHPVSFHGTLLFGLKRNGREAIGDSRHGDSARMALANSICLC